MKDIKPGDLYTENGDLYLFVQDGADLEDGFSIRLGNLIQKAVEEWWVYSDAKLLGNISGIHTSILEGLGDQELGE